jgi:hypothetical protein
MMAESFPALEKDSKFPDSRSPVNPSSVNTRKTTSRTLASAKDNGCSQRQKENCDCSQRKQHRAVI